MNLIQEMQEICDERDLEFRITKKKISVGPLPNVHTVIHNRTKNLRHDLYNLILEFDEKK